MKSKDAKKLVTLHVKWDRCVDPRRGYYVPMTGILMEVKGRNVRIGSDWKWLPDLINFRQAHDY